MYDKKIGRNPGRLFVYVKKLLIDQYAGEIVTRDEENNMDWN
jgi:hypothetical protein